MIFNAAVINAWSMKFSLVRSTVGRRYKYLHTSTVIHLNRFLFDPSEIDDDSLSNTEGCPTVTLPKSDYRTIHAAKILRLLNNDTLRAGIVLDNSIAMKTSHNNKFNQTIIDGLIRPLSSNGDKFGGMITDKATITWIPEGNIKKAEPTKNGDPPGSLKITLNELISSKDHDKNVPSHGDKSPQVSLILALPRPLALGRLLPMISMMGIDHLVLTSAQKVPKDYFGSHLFRKPNQIRDLLIEGLCQAADVKIPSVTVVNRLKPFIEDDLDNLFPKHEWARVIAHPLRKDQNDDHKVLLMDDIQFPSPAMNDESQSYKPKILLAVGPEGGWAEPYELDMFQEHGFQQITLGTRILRSDVAVISLLSLAHDVCTRRSR